MLAEAPRLFHRVDPRLRVLKAELNVLDKNIAEVSSRRPEVEGTERSISLIMCLIDARFIA